MFLYRRMHKEEFKDLLNGVAPEKEWNNGRKDEVFTRYKVGLGEDYIHFFKFAESALVHVTGFTDKEDTIIVKFDVPEHIIEEYAFGKAVYPYRNIYATDEECNEVEERHEDVPEFSNLTEYYARIGTLSTFFPEIAIPLYDYNPQWAIAYCENSDVIPEEWKQTDEWLRLMKEQHDRYDSEKKRYRLEDDPDNYILNKNTDIKRLENGDYYNIREMSYYDFCSEDREEGAFIQEYGKDYYSTYCDFEFYESMLEEQEVDEQIEDFLDEEGRLKYKIGELHSFQEVKKAILDRNLSGINNVNDEFKNMSKKQKVKNEQKGEVK